MININYILKKEEKKCKSITGVFLEHTTKWEEKEETVTYFDKSYKVIQKINSILFLIIFSSYSKIRNLRTCNFLRFTLTGLKSCMIIELMCNDVLRLGKQTL